MNTHYNFKDYYYYSIFTVMICLGASQVLSKPVEECRRQIQDLKFDIFGLVPYNDVDEICTQFAENVQCLNSRGDLEKNMLLLSEKRMIDYICKKKEDYKKSQTCLFSVSYQMLFDYRCLRSVDIIACGACEKVSKCARDQIKHVKGCTSKDADLMVILTRIFFQPIMKNRSCSADDYGPDSSSCPSPTDKKDTSTPTASTSLTITKSQRAEPTAAPTINGNSTSRVQTENDVESKSTISKDHRTLYYSTTESSNGKSMARVQTEKYVESKSTILKGHRTVYYSTTESSNGKSMARVQTEKDVESKSTISKGHRTVYYSTTESSNGKSMARVQTEKSVYGTDNGGTRCAVIHIATLLGMSLCSQMFNPM